MYQIIEVIGMPKRLYHKIWLIMRLTTVILIACLMQVSAAGLAQKITLNQRDVPLSNVLKEIRKQSGFDVFSEGKSLPKNQKVTVIVTNASIEEALDQAFKGLGYTYKIDGKTIAIKPKGEPSFFERVIAGLQVIDVKGHVVDKDGKPLVGASVSVKGTNKVVMTDESGDFEIKGLPESAVLVISFVGFEAREVDAKQNMSSITLIPSLSKLDEVQVIAYGTTTKKLSTGNIISISSEDISNQPVSNPLLALQGRVPGLTIEKSAANANATVKVRIQGQNSIANGNDPFYVIDGIPYNSQNLNSSLLSQTVGQGSPLAFINPNTIESIEILKDADATAIYGSRAANGAILITTKKGKAGSSKVEANLQNGWGTITKKINFLNTDQYLDLRREAYFSNDKLTINSPQYATQYDINGTWDQKRYTDWQDVLYGGTAKWQDFQTNVSGGSLNTQFLFGANYHKETSVLPVDANNRKASAQFSINHRSNNNKFKFSLTGNYLDDVNTLPPNELRANLPPNAPSLYTPDGNLNWETLPNGNSTWANPLGFAMLKYTVNTSNLLVNNSIGYEIINGLELKSTFGFNKLQAEENSQKPMSAFRPEERLGGIRTVDNVVKSTTNWIVEPQITYKKAIANGVFDGILGATFQNTDNNLISLLASGFVSDSQLDNIRLAPTVSIKDNIISKYRYNAIFARLNYTYNNRYILNLTGRRDGTSRFGSENMFNNFYSIGAAWIFSDEKSIKSAIPHLSFGKIRVTYGTTGSDQIDNYTYLNRYSVPTGAGVPYQGASSLIPNGLTNPLIGWEQTNKTNFGLDLGFFDNKILLNANYYRNISSKQLVNSPLSLVTGFPSFKENLPAKVLNSGLEISFDLRPITNDNFKWSTSLNLSIPKNKLIEFPDLSTNTSYSSVLEIGKSLYVQKVFKFAGVNSQTGLYEFFNREGKLTSTPNTETDFISSVDLSPKINGGWINTISYKSFQVEFLFQYIRRTQQGLNLGLNPPGDAVNQTIYALDRWRNIGDIAPLQQATTTFPSTFYSALASDANYVDLQYISLRNANLSYTLPYKLTKAFRLQNVRIYIQGQNLLTITRFPADPDISDYSGGVPPLRTITAGLQVSF